MRDTKSKSSGRNSSQTQSVPLQFELDVAALQMKNASLTKTVVKLQEENAQLRKDINNLRRENFEFQSDSVNIVRQIELITRACTPKLTDLLSAIIQIINVCSSKSLPTNNTSKDTKTHTVKPHIVNGTVIHNPTITLTRLNNTKPASQPNTNGCTNVEGIERLNIQPITSHTEQEEQIDEAGDIENENPEDVVQEKTFVSKRSAYCQRLDVSGEESFGDGISVDESELIDENNCSGRLTIIPEENSSIAVTPQSQTALSGYFQDFQEVKIYLSKLPNEPDKICSPHKDRNSASSVDALPSESHLNETENNRSLDCNHDSFHKNEDTHNTLFSPQSNSTRIDMQEPLTQISLHRKLNYQASVSIDVDTLQNTSKQLDISIPLNSNFTDQMETSSSVKLKDLQTPSASEMGDKEQSDSLKVSILKELGLSPVANNSSTSFVTTPKGKTRNRSRLSNSNHRVSELSSTEVAPENLSTSVRRRVLRKQLELEPVVVLRKLDSLLPDDKLSSSSEKLGSRANSSSIVRRKRTRAKKLSSSPEEQSDNETYEIHEATMKNIRRTLSVYMPKMDEKATTSSPARSSKTKRPTRAARPLALKEPSLHKKLRRSR